MDNIDIKKCSVSFCINLIGGKWKPIILYAILNDIKRFGEMHRTITGISKNMLTIQLRELERDEIIIRKIFPVIPPHVEYSLSKKGEMVIPLLQEIKKLGDKIKNY